LANHHFFASAFHLPKSERLAKSPIHGLRHTRSNVTYKMMTAPTLYKQAPITEALLDLRVENMRNLSPAQFRQELSSLSNDYPNQKDMVDVASQVSFGETVGATTRQTPIGVFFTSTDGKQALQARQDGMTFGRLAPYERWETFRDEARRLWKLYREVTNTQQLLRVAVRYINRLDIPLPSVQFKDYLRTLPEVSPDLTQGLSGYFMQLQLPQEDIKAMLIINQALVPPPASDKTSVLLDIELAREVDLVNDEEFLWDYLEQLRFRKNQVFNDCLTEKMKELIH